MQPSGNADEEGAPAPRSRPRIVSPYAKAFALLSVVAAAGVTTWLAHRGPSAAPRPHPAVVSRRAQAARHAWEITGANAARIERVDAPLAQGLFGTSASFGLGNRAARQDQVPAGSGAVPTLVYRSLAAFRADLRRGRIDSRIRAVLYDPERWPSTPAAEQRDPLAAMRQFGQLAHAHGYKVVLAPGRDLLAVPGARCGANGQSLDQAYLRCGFARAARFADVFSIQSQADEFDVPAFRAFVVAAAAQARAAHPGVRIFAGISTNPATGRARSTDLTRAVRSVDGTVNGFWANVFVRRPGQLQTAIAFFRSLARG
ncbi:MAG TPA: hypothetical protein VGL44_08095 [Gaiellales bacterium]|jgi:hypothetical protein